VDRDESLMKVFLVIDVHLMLRMMHLFVFGLESLTCGLCGTSE
jgi:hypothetical protein